MQRETLRFCLRIPNWADRHTPVVTMGKHTKAELSTFFALDVKTQRLCIFALCFPPITFFS